MWFRDIYYVYIINSHVPGYLRQGVWAQFITVLLMLSPWSLVSGKNKAASRTAKNSAAQDKKSCLPAKKNHFRMADSRTQRTVFWGGGIWRLCLSALYCGGSSVARSRLIQNRYHDLPQGFFSVASVTRGYSRPFSAGARVIPVLRTPPLPQAMEGAILELSGIIQIALDQIIRRPAILGGRARPDPSQPGNPRGSHP